MPPPLRTLGPVDMARSIIKSSNVYYYSLANEMGVDLMHEQLSPFGFGRHTGIDIDGEVTGVLPRAKRTRAGLEAAEVEDLGEPALGRLLDAAARLLALAAPGRPFRRA